MSLGLIIPLVSIGLATLVVVSCLIWHSWYGRKVKKVQGRYELSQIVTNLSSSLQTGACYSEWNNTPKSSIRSATPLRQISESRRDGTASRLRCGHLGRISESPEDRLVRQRAKMSTSPCTRAAPADKAEVFTCDDSIASMISKWKADVPTVSGSLQHHLESPLNAPYMSQSYPNLALSAQAPFSPYHLTWVSPSPMVHSHSVVVDSGQCGIYPIATRLTSAGTVSDATTNSSWKSPYHPNYNTPTGSDTDCSPIPPPNTILNHTRSVNTPESHHHPGAAVGPCITENTVNLHTTGGRIMAHPYIPQTQCKSHPAENGHFISGKKAQVVNIRTCSDGGTSHSCPGNVGSWHYNKMYRHSCDICQDQSRGWSAMAHHHSGPGDMANSCEECYSGLTSADTSMCPMMGSSGNTSMVHPACRRVSLPYLLLASFNNSATGSRVLPASGGSSVCGQVDSCETSRSGSNFTAVGNHSGYQGGISHSTSVNNTNASSGKNTTTSHGSGANTTVQGISSIQGTPGGRGILGSLTPSTQQGDSMETTGLTTDTGNTLSNTAHSAPAAFASFNMSISGQNGARASLEDNGNAQTLEWDSFAHENPIRSDGSHHGNPQNNSITDDVFSPASKTDSSLRSVSLSPFRVEALAVISGRASFVSVVGSENSGFHWDSSYDALNAPGQSSQSAAFPEPPPYTPTVPVLADTQYWV